MVVTVSAAEFPLTLGRQCGWLLGDAQLTQPSSQQRRFHLAMEKHQLPPRRHPGPHCGLTSVSSVPLIRGAERDSGATDYPRPMMRTACPPTNCFSTRLLQRSTPLGASIIGSQHTIEPGNWQYTVLLHVLPDGSPQRKPGWGVLGRPEPQVLALSGRHERPSGQSVRFPNPSLGCAAPPRPLARPVSASATT